jgi:hypothetical protein
LCLFSLLKLYRSLKCQRLQLSKALHNFGRIFALKRHREPTSLALIFILSKQLHRVQRKQRLPSWDGFLLWQVIVIICAFIFKKNRKRQTLREYLLNIQGGHQLALLLSIWWSFDLQKILAGHHRVSDEWQNHIGRNLHFLLWTFFSL